MGGIFFMFNLLLIESTLVQGGKDLFQQQTFTKIIMVLNVIFSFRQFLIQIWQLSRIASTSPVKW